jgi:hypothetical protein
MKELIEKLPLPVFRDWVGFGAILVILVKERCRKSAKHPHYRESVRELGAVTPAINNYDSLCLIVTEILLVVSM